MGTEVGPAILGIPFRPAATVTHVSGKRQTPVGATAPFPLCSQLAAGAPPTDAVVGAPLAATTGQTPAAVSLPPVEVEGAQPAASASQRPVVLPTRPLPPRTSLVVPATFLAGVAIRASRARASSVRVPRGRPAPDLRRTLLLQTTPRVAAPTQDPGTGPRSLPVRSLAFQTPFSSPRRPVDLYRLPGALLERCRVEGG